MRLFGVVRRSLIWDRLFSFISETWLLALVSGSSELMKMLFGESQGEKRPKSPKEIKVSWGDMCLVFLGRSGPIVWGLVSERNQKRTCSHAGGSVFMVELLLRSCGSQMLLILEHHISLFIIFFGFYFFVSACSSGVVFRVFIFLFRMSLHKFRLSVYSSLIFFFKSVWRLTLENIFWKLTSIRYWTVVISPDLL